ncbi:MAG: hypothetical protein EOP81_18225 [Variovorax sp.]|nr:MAG: hypothetical protein EOP81_18225 [Variovorax sp.]
MAAQHSHSAPETAPLVQTLQKTKAVADEVQRAADNLSVVSTVLEQELPNEVQAGDVAQAVAQTGQLEKKLAKSAEKLVQANEALGKEIDRRLELTLERDQMQARNEALEAALREQRATD